MRTRMFGCLAVVSLTTNLLFAGETEVIEMTVTPRRAVSAASAPRLLPSEAEMRDGNAAPVILRMTYQRSNFVKNQLPVIDAIAELPPFDSRVSEFPFDGIEKQLAEAALIRDADWEYPLDSDRPYEILLPDAQSMRDYVGRGMKIWINQQLASGDLPSAVGGVRTQLACARHVGRSPLFVSQLIATAIAQVGIERLEVIASTPNSNNLYWSLAMLPDMLCDPIIAIQQESRSFRQSIPSVRRRLPAAGSVQWDTAAEELLALLARVDPNQFSQRAREGLLRTGYQQADGFVRSCGLFDPPELAKMTDNEKFVRWYLLASENLHRETEAAMQAPAPVAVSRLIALGDSTAHRGAPPMPFAADMLRIYVGLKRFERTVRLLQAFEAIRDYADSHDGKLPDSLDQLRLPAPNDPMTQSPLGYSVSDSGATLQWNPLPGLPDEPIRTYRLGF